MKYSQNTLEIWAASQHFNLSEYLTVNSFRNWTFVYCQIENTPNIFKDFLKTEISILHLTEHIILRNQPIKRKTRVFLCNKKQDHESRFKIKMETKF